jgi:hypothetical protein
MDDKTQVSYFLLGTRDSSTNKTDHNTKTKLLLEVVLNNNHKKKVIVKLNMNVWITLKKTDITKCTVTKNKTWSLLLIMDNWRRKHLTENHLNKKRLLL